MKNIRIQIENTNIETVKVLTAFKFNERHASYLSKVDPNNEIEIAYYAKENFSYQDDETDEWNEMKRYVIADKSLSHMYIITQSSLISSLEEIISNFETDFATMKYNVVKGKSKKGFIYYNLVPIFNITDEDELQF